MAGSDALVRVASRESSRPAATPSNCAASRSTSDGRLSGEPLAVARAATRRPGIERIRAVRTTSRDLALIFLVDVSASVAQDQQRDTIEFINREVAKAAPRDFVGVIAFGRDASVELAPTPRPIIETANTARPASLRSVRTAYRRSWRIESSSGRRRVPRARRDPVPPPRRGRASPRRGDASRREHRRVAHFRRCHGSGARLRTVTARPCGIGAG